MSESSGEETVEVAATMSHHPHEVRRKTLDELLAFLRPHDRTMIVVDGANTSSASRNLAFDIDFQLLREAINSRSCLIEATYFTAIPDNESGDWLPIRPLVDWLAYNRWTVKSKTARVFGHEDNKPKYKGDMDVDIAVHVMRLLSNGALKSGDVLFFFSGDSDFTPLVLEAKMMGVSVIVVSTFACIPAVISDELRRAATVFLDLNDMRQFISRTATDRGRARARPVHIVPSNKHTGEE